MKIYVGNLSYDTTEEGLRVAFEAYGAVESASIVVDRETNRSKGFGFVVMPEEEEARAAIDNLNGKELDRRELRVNEARSTSERSGGFRRHNYGARGPRRYDS